MALFMNREELEAIRPPNVSMGRMRAWYCAKRWFQASIVLLFVGLAASDLAKDGGVLTTVGAVNLGLSFLAWMGGLLFAFARYSLRTLLVIVLFTTGLFTGYFISSNEEQRLLFATSLGLWAVYVALVVLDLDPESTAKAKWKARMKETASEKETGGSERPGA